ncbi:hypothetical protein LINPERPRIM_LOCUS28760, partial [Linum perenne]
GKLFTIELHYGGVLIGNDYKYGLTSYFDLVEADTFSLHDLNKMTEFVGVYGGIFEYLWLVPGEEIPVGLKPLHCDDDIRTLTEGLTPARTVCVYINKLSEFQARRRLAQVQLRLFEVVTRRRGVVIEEVMEAGGNGPGEGVVGSGNANNHLLALEYSVGADGVVLEGGTGVQGQGHTEDVRGPITDSASEGRRSPVGEAPPNHQSPNSPTSPPPTPAAPPEIPANPTSPPPTHTPPPDSPVNPTSPPLTHSPPQENLDTPPLPEDDSSGYLYSSDDESFRADERELGDESSENEAFEYDEDEVDSALDNVLRRRASSSSNQATPRTPTASDAESDCDGPYNEADLLNQTGWGSEEEDRVPRQFPVFQPGRDLDDPELKLGTVFESLAQFKQFCRANAVKQRRGIWFPTNDKKRCRCECKKACGFWLYASVDPSTHDVKLRSGSTTHDCSADDDVRAATYDFLATKYLGRFRIDPSWGLGNIIHTVLTDMSLKINRTKAYRMKQAAMRKIHGEDGQQWAKLWDYKAELERTNPGSTIQIDYEVLTFRRIYVCLEPLKRGFLAGCRRFVGVDGCFLKNVNGWQLLSAVGVDGNGGMYPIAWAVVESETTESWDWFIGLLAADLMIEDSTEWTWMSDKQKVTHTFINCTYCMLQCLHL